MTHTLDVETDRSPITDPDDDRVCKGKDGEPKYFLENQDGTRTILVFVGASLGPVEKGGVLQTRINPAAVRVGVGDKLRWIIENTHDQTDTTEIQIVRDDPNAFWPFEGSSPDQDPDQFTSLRGKKNGKGNDFAETVGGRLQEPQTDPTVPIRTKYNIRITFKENADDPKSPELKATIDPDVVYNPPGF